MQREGLGGTLMYSKVTTFFTGKIKNNLFLLVKVEDPIVNFKNVNSNKIGEYLYFKSVKE